MHEPKHTSLSTPYWMFFTLTLLPIFKYSIMAQQISLTSYVLPLHVVIIILCGVICLYIWLWPHLTTTTTTHSILVQTIWQFSHTYVFLTTIYACIWCEQNCPPSEDNASTPSEVDIAKERTNTAFAMNINCKVFYYMGLRICFIYSFDGIDTASCVSFGTCLLKFFVLCAMIGYLGMTTAQKLEKFSEEKKPDAETKKRRFQEELRQQGIKYSQSKSSDKVTRVERRRKDAIVHSDDGTFEQHSFYLG
jgi:hypothetical protein